MTTADIFPTIPDVDLWENELNKFEEIGPGLYPDARDRPSPGAAPTGEPEARADRAEPKHDHKNTQPAADAAQENDLPNAPMLVSALDVINETPGVEIVEGMGPAGSIVVIAGESTAGKTFITLNLAGAICDGQKFFGRNVWTGSVAYISFEADAISLRLLALHDQGSTLQHVHILRATDPISPRVGRDGIEEPSFGEKAVVNRIQRLAADLLAKGEPPLVAIFIDTIRTSLSGSEDNSENVAAYLRAVRRILKAAPEAMAVLVHHSGWQDGESKKKRERGSSAFRGNVDATLYVEVTEDDPENHQAFLELRTLKVRDGERPAPLQLLRQRVDIRRFDPYGNPMSSCIITRDTRTKADTEAQAKAETAAEQEANDLKVLRTIRDYPKATSQALLRVHAAIKTGVLSDSLGRLLTAHLAIPPSKQRRPYEVTAKGHAFLAEKSTTQGHQ